MVNEVSAFVTIVRAKLVSTLRMVMFPPGAAACAESVTIPVTVARSLCADRTQGRTSTNDRYRAKPDKFLHPFVRIVTQDSGKGFATPHAAKVIRLQPAESAEPPSEPRQSDTPRRAGGLLSCSASKAV